MSAESDKIAAAYAKNRGKFRLLNVYLPAAGPFGLILFIFMPIGAFGVIALMVVGYIWISKFTKTARTVEGEIQLLPIPRIWIAVSAVLVIAAITLFVIQALHG